MTDKMQHQERDKPANMHLVQARHRGAGGIYEVEQAPERPEDWRKVMEEQQVQKPRYDFG